MSVQHVLAGQTATSNITIDFNFLPALPRGRAARSLRVKEYLDEVRRALLAWEYRELSIDE